MRRVRHRSVSRIIRAAGVISAGMALAVTAACTSSKSGGTTGPASAKLPQSAPVSSAVATSGGAGAKSASTSASPHPTTYAPVPVRTDASASQTTKPPAPISSMVAFGGKVTGRITSIQSVTGHATQAGEISGPALAITVRIKNGSSERIDLDNAVVTLAYGRALTPASAISGPPNHFFSGFLSARKSTSGTYVFTVPTADQRKLLTIGVSYSPDAPAVVFTGKK